MNNIPNKIMWYLGYNNLGLILEQERKHWLLKTDKLKQAQDKTTGDIFQGQIDNIGTDIIVESEKLDIRNNILPTLKFQDEGCNSIFDFADAAFPFSYEMRGFSFARITSINYPYESSDELQNKNYKICFENANTVNLVFGSSPLTSEVYATKWLETSTVPTIKMMDDNGQYTISVSLNILGLTGSKFYYPLEPGLQPFVLNNISQGTYESESINDDGYIGYPLFWFIGDELKTGPSLELNPTTGHNSRNMKYMFISNEGNSESRYDAKAYVNVDGTDAYGATPDAELPINYEIRVSPPTGVQFEDALSDFNIPLDISSISFYKKGSGTTTPIQLLSAIGQTNVIRMSKNVGWVYVDQSTYKVDMECFTANNEEQFGSKSPLTPIFDITLDRTVTFYSNNSVNVGIAGLRASSAYPVSDTYGRYPHDLDQWTGLPEWLQDIPENGVPQHLSVYAIHNTPGYTQVDPESRQVAAMLFDPGKIKTSEGEGFDNDEKGRIYVISNDPITYENNATAENPKPARTVARICDIPTSIADFMNVNNIVPVAVVDEKYVRSEASYTDDQKDILYNTLASRIVTPEAEDIDGIPFHIEEGATREPYKYVWYNKDNLNNVDLVSHNNFREWVNLNPEVDASTITVHNIVNGGEKYEVGSIGIIIIGGVSLNFVVDAVDDIDGRTGVATEVRVVPQQLGQTINLSNFDMDEGNTGRTQIYGTMCVSVSQTYGVKGEGLKVILNIPDYVNLKTHQGYIYDDLVAFVYDDNQLQLFKYVNDNTTLYHTGRWMSYFTIAQFDKSTPIKENGGYSTTDAMTNAVIPKFKEIQVCHETNGRALEKIKAMATASFVNIIDTTHVPFNTGSGTTYNHVDLCKFHAGALISATALNRTEEQVFEKIKSMVTLDRDCYLFWKWDNSVSSNFKFGIIRRSLNNYLTTDTTTTLPPTNLKYDSYVHSNAGTTVVWDVPGFGPMMWVYNPNYNKHEIYTINEATQDLYISYTNEDDVLHPNEMNWNEIDIEISTAGYQVVKMVDPDGKMNFNVYTNNPVQSTDKISHGVYDEYEFVQIASVGQDASTVNVKPVGNWQLVYPRLKQFKIVSENVQQGVYHSEVKLRQLTPLNGESLGNINEVLDSNGKNINQKVVIFDSTESGVDMKVFNSKTGQFEIV